MKSYPVWFGVGLALAVTACETKNTSYMEDAEVTTISQTTLVTVVGGTDLNVTPAPVNAYTDAAGRPCQIHSFRDAEGPGIATVCFDGTVWVLIDRSYDTRPGAVAGNTNPAGDWSAVTE